ncbi:MAG: AAC(3) family N-acetyltransferase [Candidatus Heimdallarchaeota archaeon]|nr:AAC(3) family N-acetyltransferase [Candidatus Heimdallarchaeota archaeon]
MNQAIGEYTPSTTSLSALSYINPEKNQSNVQVLPLTPVKCVVLTIHLFWQDCISFEDSVVYGKRIWKGFEDLDYNDEDFPQIGADFEREQPILQGKIGQANSKLIQMKELVDFAVVWMEKNRT